MSASEVDSGLRKIGEYLPCPQADIDWALSVQAMESSSGNTRRLGEILMGRQEVTQEALANALESQLVDRLRMSSLLGSLSREELVKIGERTDQITLQPGETLFQEGYRGDGMYVILKGRLLLSCLAERTEDPAGAAIPGDVLGEGGCFTDGTRLCSAYATERSELLKIRYSLIPRDIDIEKKASPPPSPVRIVQRVRSALRADRAYLFVRDQESGDLTAKTGEGEKCCEFSFPAGTDVVGWVALRRESVNLREAYLDPRFEPAMDIQTGYWTRTLLAAPILGEHGEVLGVLEAVNKHEGWFNSDDEAVLRAFVRQCAAAICNSRIA